MLFSRSKGRSSRVPGSGTLGIPAIPTIAAVARRRGALCLLDSTWATPVFCWPVALGVDLVLHSESKPIGGHADWKRDFSGASGLFSVLFKPCSAAQLRAFADGLQMFGVGVSWGGFERLVLPVEPHRTDNIWEESGSLVRFHIGNESTDSLIADPARP